MLPVFGSLAYGLWELFTYAFGESDEEFYERNTVHLVRHCNGETYAGLGVRISPSFIITAAHVVDDFARGHCSSLSAWEAGESWHFRSEIRRENLVVHPDYFESKIPGKAESPDDLAIIKIDARDVNGRTYPQLGNLVGGPVVVTKTMEKDLCPSLDFFAPSNVFRKEGRFVWDREFHIPEFCRCWSITCPLAMKKGDSGGGFLI